MEKFIKRIGLYLICSFLVTNLVIYYFMKLSPEYFLDYRYDYAFYNYHVNEVNSTTNYKNVIFGDSKGQCISPKTLGNSWLNLSEHAAGFFQDYFTLKYYLKHNKVDTLLIYHTPLVVTGFNDLDYLNRTAIPAKFVEFADIKSLENVEAKYGNIVSQPQHLNPIQLLIKQYQRELRYAHFPFSYSSTFLEDFSSFTSLNENFEEKSKERIHFVQQNLGQDLCGDSPYNSSIHYTCTYERLQQKCTPDPVNFAYLDSIVTLTKANHIVFYLAVAPFNETTYKVYKNSVYEKSISELFKQNCEKYPNIKLITKPESLPDSTFGDHYLHPNKKGAIIVSNQLKEQIKLSKQTIL